MNVAGAIEPEVASDSARDVVVREVAEGNADELKGASSFFEKVFLEVGIGAASELPKFVSKIGVGVSLGLGPMPTKLARVVASTGGMKVKLALNSANRLEASPASVAVVVYVVVI